MTVIGVYNQVLISYRPEICQNNSPDLGTTSHSSLPTVVTTSTPTTIDRHQLPSSHVINEYVAGAVAGR